MEFAQFKEQMRQTFGLDLNSYKENQLRRRLTGYLARLNLPGFQALYARLQSDRNAYEAFLDFLTINVSEFFRDPARWTELEKEILPQLLAGKQGGLKIWSAACANGAEPYSLAIILKELSPFRPHRLLATDIDKNVLEQARQGRYHPDAVRHVSKERLKKFFEPAGNAFVLKDEIKKMVTFRQHDLLTQPFEEGWNLIVCRNVSIYFTREAQNQLNSKLAKSLARGGFLFIGGSEMIFNYKELGLERARTSFYQKVAGLQEVKR
ncbi:MAG: protein-glutamate O-methyltransferase CheR [Armatimonadetes bacterium]|nr:protein-glutamate O-methyltransferase CheR [Armatimonadota bacterium]